MQSSIANDLIVEMNAAAWTSAKLIQKFCDTHFFPKAHGMTNVILRNLSRPQWYCEAIIVRRNMINNLLHLFSAFKLHNHEQCSSSGAP